MAREGSLLDWMEVLGRQPWWVSVLLAAVVFAGLRWVVPWAFAQPEEAESLVSALFAPVASTVPAFAPIAAAFFLIPAAMSGFRRWRDGNRGAKESTPIHLRNWNDVVVKYYGREGYRPTAHGADRGVDLTLENDSGKLLLVRCEHPAQRPKVDRKLVYALYSKMVAQGAHEGVLVTSASFTADAREFAEDKPITLAEEADFKKMLAKVQRTDGASGRQ